MQLSRVISLQENTNEGDTAPELKLTAEVVFGISSQGCRGAGICKLTTISTSETENKLMSPCKKGVVTISKISKQRLCFQFEKASMCKKAITTNFKYGYFTIPEDFYLPGFISEQLMPCGRVISKGIYPVIETAETFTIVF